jgi:hypothetical protein
MKLSNLSTWSALLITQAYACTRLRVDQYVDPNDVNQKFTNIKLWDNDNAPLDFYQQRSSQYGIGQETFTEGSGRYAVTLVYSHGQFNEVYDGSVYFYGPASMLMKVSCDCLT